MIYKFFCKLCNKEFERYESKKNLHKNKYCSLKCCSKDINSKNKGIKKTICLFCANCNKEIHKRKCDFTNLKKAFCSHSCAATFNNSKFPKRKLAGLCKTCGKHCSTNRTYCKKCVGDNNIKTYIKNIKISNWIFGEWNGGNYSLSPTIRKFLIEKENFKCSKCPECRRHPNGDSVLQINHIDGNALNHRPENLEVICPTCHVLTPNYGSKNKNSARIKRYKRK